MIARLTIAFPYWEAPRMLQENLSQLRAWPDDLRRRLTLIVCDDCSMRHPANADLVASQPFDARLYRITRKEPWNYRGAKNIAMHEAPQGWAFITDIDHVLTAEGARQVFASNVDAARIYTFRRTDPSGREVRAVDALQLMSREMYWRVGGYDESFVGTHMGWAGERAGRIKKAAGNMQRLPINLVRYMRRDVGDEPDGLVRGREPYRDAVDRIKANWTGVKTMTFPYERVV